MSKKISQLDLFLYSSLIPHPSSLNENYFLDIKINVHYFSAYLFNSE